MSRWLHGGGAFFRSMIVPSFYFHAPKQARIALNGCSILSCSAFEIEQEPSQNSRPTHRYPNPYFFSFNRNFFHVRHSRSWNIRQNYFNALTPCIIIFSSYSSRPQLHPSAHSSSANMITSMNPSRRCVLLKAALFLPRPHLFSPASTADDGRPVSSGDAEDVCIPFALSEFSRTLPFEAIFRAINLLLGKQPLRGISLWYATLECLFIVV